MTLLIRTTFLPVIACLVSLSLNAIATAHFDIFVTNLSDVKTGIGGADVDEGEFDTSTRVFESILVVDSGTPDYSRNEPGFFALTNLAPGSFFPDGAQPLEENSLVSIAFRSFSVGGNSAELFYWDGSGAVDFQPALSTNIALNEWQEYASGNGSLEFHPYFQIDDPLGTAANGVYLASLTALAGDLAPSDPVFLVMLVDSSITDANAEQIEGEIEEGLAFTFFEEAVEYVETRVAVPEPASWTALLLGVFGFVLWGRQRR